MEEILTEGLPDGVPLVADFNHTFNQLNYYYPRLVDETSVRVPDTRFFEVSVNDSTPDFDEGAISEWMVENGYKQAFVRGMYASAKTDLQAGSHLHSQDRNDIRQTVSELVRQHIILDRPLGDRIATREMIDLEYCANPDCQRWHPTEVRYFIEDGEVDYRFPSKETFIEKNRECPELFSYVDFDMDALEYPDDWAEEVAREFDELSWSVDFIRDAVTGKWYCNDMGLNGLYYNETTEEWVSICGHDDGKGPGQYVDQMEDWMWRATFDGADWLRWAEENAE